MASPHPRADPPRHATGVEAVAAARAAIRTAETANVAAHKAAAQAGPTAQGTLGVQGGTSPWWRVGQWSWKARGVCLVLLVVATTLVVVVCVVRGRGDDVEEGEGVTDAQSGKSVAPAHNVHARAHKGQRGCRRTSPPPA